MTQYVHTKKEFGENLRLIRKKRRLSQTDFARVLKLHRSIWSNYESGKTIPDILRLIELSEALDINFLDFISK